MDNLDNLRLTRKEAELVRTALKYYMAQASKGRLTLWEGTTKELEELTSRFSNAIIGTMLEKHVQLD
jgi:hypothetical protein